MGDSVEARILEHAVAKGLIDERDVESAGESSSQGRWGARIEWLIAEGRLDEIAVAALAEGLDGWSPAELASTVDSKPPRRLERALFRGWDRYVIVSRLGGGGGGEVFRARDPRLDREVALKFLTDRSEVAARLRREAQAQARVDHEHVCKVFEVGEVEGHSYIAMQFIDGQTFGAAAASMTVEQRVRVVHQVAEAVEAAHRLGIIHRDLKPSNVMVQRDQQGAWRAWVVDFGLARELERSGASLDSVVGTPAFMAPEQARSDAARVDRRSDVYALGATLFAVLAERPPFLGSSVEILLKIVSEEPPPRLRQLVPSLPRDLESIVAKCLSPEPRGRYDSAGALADDLGRFLAGEPIRARPTPWPRRLARRLRRHLALTAAVVSAIAAVASMATWRLRSPSASDRARRAQPFTDPTEAQLYADAQARMRALDAASALPLYEKLVAAAPESALAHVALSEAWTALGDDARAQREAERAATLVTADSDSATKLTVEARRCLGTGAWDKALVALRALHSFYPDDLEAGLDLAFAEAHAGKGRDGLDTIAELERLPAAASDPRVRLAEAAVAESLGDYRRDHEAAVDAARRAQTAGSRGALARARLLDGWALLNLKQSPAAAQSLIEARDLFAAAGQAVGAARATQQLAMLHAMDGAMAQANQELAQALAEFRRIGNRRGEARTLNAMANLLDDNPTKARELYEQALAIDRAIGDHDGVSAALNNLATLECQAGVLADCERHFADALLAERAASNQAGTAAALGNLASVRIELGDLAGGNALVEEQLVLAQKLGSAADQAQATTLLGWVLMYRGELASARQRLDEAAALYRSLGQRGYEAECLRMRARAALWAQLPKEAAAEAAPLVAIFNSVEQPGAAATAAALVAESWLDRGDRVRARAAFEQVKARPNETSMADLRLDYTLAEARLLAAEGHRAQAARMLDELAAWTHRSGYLAGELLARVYRARVEIASGQRANGHRELARLADEARSHGFHVMASLASRDRL
jgi:tetratricopeptide (TPR) repeat protein/predicted Ser/Thr protein kinase